MDDESTELSILQRVFKRAKNATQLGTHYSPNRAEQRMVTKYDEIDRNLGKILDKQMKGDQLSSEELSLLEDNRQRLVNYRNLKP